MSILSLGLEIWVKFHLLPDFNLFIKILPKIATEEMRKEAHILRGDSLNFFIVKLQYSVSYNMTVQLCSLMR